MPARSTALSGLAKKTSCSHGQNRSRNRVGGRWQASAMRPNANRLRCVAFLSMHGATEQGWKPSAQSKSMWKGLSLQFFEELSAYFGKCGQSCCLKCANHFLDKPVHRL